MIFLGSWRNHVAKIRTGPVCQKIASKDLSVWSGLNLLWLQPHPARVRVLPQGVGFTWVHPSPPLNLVYVDFPSRHNFSPVYRSLSSTFLSLANQSYFFAYLHCSLCGLQSQSPAPSSANLPSKSLVTVSNCPPTNLSPSRWSEETFSPFAQMKHLATSSQLANSLCGPRLPLLSLST